MTDRLSRRDLLGRIAIAVAATAAAPAINAQAGAPPPHVDPDKDATAKALGYVADATKVDAKKYAAYKPGQNCSSCVQLQGKAGDAFRPCVLFPGKLVSAQGWCSGYVKKP